MREATMAGALKKLYEKVIGDEPTEKTTTQILDEFAENYESGGGLPSVTAEDNGDVLTVVEGAWAKAEPSGGGGDLVITLTESGDSYAIDKTAAELQAAAQAKIPMRVWVATYKYFVGVKQVKFGVDGTTLAQLVACDLYDGTFDTEAWTCSALNAAKVTITNNDGALTVDYIDGEIAGQ